jgi:hypothetical protein
MFQGRIVQPAGTKLEDGILYVRSRNGMARKVRVEKAVIEFDEDVPKSRRVKDAAKSLCDDTLVRVTAEQSDKEDGEWKALSILILPDPKHDSSQDTRIKQATFLQEPAARHSFVQKADGQSGQKAKDKPGANEDPDSAETKAGKGPGTANTNFCVR